jgi:hypothetical protein
MKKNKPMPANYLEKVLVRNEKIGFSTDEKGIVTLEIENTGAMNRIAQKLFRKPKTSYIHLDHKKQCFPQIKHKGVPF